MAELFEKILAEKDITKREEMFNAALKMNHSMLQAALARR